jgi:predicted outer membrane repeat protein
VTGSAANPVVFADDSATKYGGAVYAYNGGSITSSNFEGNTAEWGGAVFSQDIGWTFTDSTIRNNDALHTGGGVYAWQGSTAFYRSAIVGNHANYTGGGVGTAGSLTFENSFIGSNSLSGGNAGNGAGIRALGDVHLRVTTVYDNYSSGGASEISADNVTSVMSVVGNSGTGNIWEFAGSLDDSYSVSTADDTQFGGIGSGDVAPGSLGFGSLDGTAPGQLGSTPDPTSVLTLPTTSSGFAPAANPLPLVTRDQLGNLRLAPFTIGARSAVVAAAPSVTSVTPASGSTGGGDVVTIHGSGFTGATGASIGGSAVTNLVVVNDTTITGTTPTGSAGAAAVSVTGPGGTGSLPSGFTFVTPTPPAPNPPAPAVPASAPRDVRAEAGVESLEASWVPPQSSGTFPVTSYQVVASPGGQACLVTAPALTCTITGLTAGTPYTVTARALTGAGWGATSSPSETVVPLSPPTPAATILITSSRDRAQKSIARVEGTTTGLVGAEVVPYVRIAGQKAFAPRASTRTVDADGNFVWQRKANKRFTVYFVSGDVTSNRLVIRPE